MAFLPTVAHAFLQSEDKIGTQLIFPIQLSHLWNSENSEVVTSVPIILFAASLLNSGIGMSLSLISCCHFSLFSVCKILMARCKLEKDPSMSAVWKNCRSRLAGNKPPRDAGLIHLHGFPSSVCNHSDFKEVFYKFLHSKHCREKCLFILPISCSQKQLYNSW